MPEDLAAAMRAGPAPPCPHARDTRLRAGGWLVGGAAALLGLTAFTVDARGSWAGISIATWIGLVSGAGLGVLGALVIDHQPRNRAAWMLAVSGLLLALQAAVTTAVGAANPHAFGPAATTSLRYVTVLDEVNFASGFVFLFLFPAGQTPRGRWRWAWRGALGTLAVVVPITAVAAWGLPGDSLAVYTAEPRGVEMPDPSSTQLTVLSAVDLSIQLWWLVAAAFLVALLRASPPAIRRQLRYAIAGLVATTAILIVGYALVGWPAEIAAPIPLYVGVFIAMRHHDLWQIERLVRRATLYAGLTLLLAAGYVSTVLLLTLSISALTPRSPVVVCAATLVVATGFGPLRRRLQSWLDRRFDQRTWQVVQAIEEFSESLRLGTRQPREIEQALQRALGEPSVRALYFSSSGGLIDGDGDPLEPSEDPGYALTTVSTGGLDVAVVELPAAFAAAHPQLLTAALTTAALPLENAALHARAATQLADVRASRARLVEAADLERRRLERDLHDGAQQRLVALALRLRLAQRRLQDREPAEAARLSEAVDDLRAAVDELRDLSRGMLPPVLAEEGLGVALGTLRMRVPLPLSLDVPSARFSTDVEAAVWFVSCEGLANSVKHAQAGALGILVRHDGRSLRVEVSDDGVGGAVLAQDGGLQGLADRVAALGGRLTVTSRAGFGTTLAADLPCAS